jgi:hypothetical protein
MPLRAHVAPKRELFTNLLRFAKRKSRPLSRAATGLSLLILFGLRDQALHFSDAVLEMLDCRGPQVHTWVPPSLALRELDPIPIEKLEMRFQLARPAPQVIDELLTV